MTITTDTPAALAVTAARGTWLDALNACALGVSRSRGVTMVTIARDEHGTVLSSNDGTFCVHHVLDERPGAPLSWGLDHQALTALVRGLAADRHTTSDALPVELRAQGDVVHVWCRGAVAGRVPMVFDVAACPVEADALVAVETRALKRLAGQVLYAAARDCEGLEQVRVAAAGAWLDVVATDRHRLATGSVRLDGDATFDAFPGARQLARVLRLCKDRTTRLGAAPHGSLTIASGPLRVTIARHTDIPFPHMQWASHFVSGTWVEVDRGQLLAACAWAQDLGVEDAVVVELRDGAATCRLHAGHVEDHAPARDITQRASHALDQVSGHRDGTLLVAFRPATLVEAVEHHSTPTIRLTLTRPAGPVMVSDARHDITDPHTPRSVLMSLRDAH